MATKLLVCLVIVAAASAVPLIRDDFDSQSDFPSYQCARQCKGKPSKFNYQPSKTYVYQYRAEAETNVAGASEDKAKMYIETHANIEVMSQCDFALRLENVNVYHSVPYSDSMKRAEQQSEFQRVLTQNPLRFSFDDGIIRDICHQSQEKIWVLNFKRGLLSAFQNSMDNLDKDQKVKEVDVSGKCHSEYNKKNEWPWERSIKLSKSKDLLACYKHSGVRSHIPMVPYNIASDIQHLPIMKSSHQCDYVVSSSRILESAVCKESHVFAPFSNHQSGGATNIQQALTFLTTKHGIETRQDNIDVRSNLLYKHLNGNDEVQNSRQVAEQKLKEICDQTKIDIRPETPRLFTEIVRSVKDMDPSDLKDLYDMLKNRNLCRQNERAMKFFMDTLPIANTNGAVELMATVINNDEIPDVEKKVWLTSLSLIPEPSEEMLPSLMKLLNGQYSNQALLPVSALLHTMCKKNVECDRSYRFKQVVNRINQNIDSSCSSDDRSQLMETLRAIGNVGYGQSFLRTLETCLRSRYAPLEVKVAAADAYRRFQCQDDEENGPLFEVYESQNADSELRIMSFLSLMRCPRDSVLRKIAAQLDREQDVHVGTFVYTHLEALKQTSDPHKQDTAEAVRRLVLRKFDDGSFKTSRSHESSALLNKVNMGYVANGDLIWSQSSMVPRALRVNLTVEMFGNSINLFEAGARMDGLDRFVQKYFGTEGYFSQNQASVDELEAFIYARMFGNEFYFKHMKGTHEYEKAKSHLNFDKILENLSQQYDLRYTHSQQLMDQSLIIPTTIGLPVNMTMNSSVTVDTDAKGEIDFSGILSRSKPITITSNIKASAGLEVTGSMMVDAMLYKQGVRMRNTLHSSVNLKANMQIKQRQIVNFEIESPEEKQELFDARSQFFIVHDNVEKEQEMIKENRKEWDGCTGEEFTKVTGVELCGEVHYANASLKEDAPYFPLTGPARATLTMNKKDTQRNYKIFAKWIKNSKKLEAQLQLDTPGSRVDRHISADVTIGTHKNQHVDLVFISPWKKLVLNGKAARNNEIASLTGTIVVDNTKEYKLTSEMKMQETDHSIELLPFVEVEHGRERITLVKGSMSYTPNKNIQTKLELTDLKQRQYTLGSEFINQPDEKKIELSVGKKEDKPYKIRIGSVLKHSGRKDQNIEFDPELLIQTPKGEIVSFKSNTKFQPKPLKVVGNMTLDTIRMRKPITLKVDVTQKKQSYPVVVKFQSPILSGDVRGRVDVRKNSYSTGMKMNYRTTSKSDTVILVGKLLDKSKKTYTQYNLNSNLKFKSMPEYNTISNLEVNHKKKATAKLNVYYSGQSKKINYKKQQPDIQVFASAGTNIKSLKQAHVQANLKARVPEKNVDIKINLDHEHTPKKVESEVKLHLSPFLENDINADIHIQNKGRSLYDINADGNLEADGKKYNLKSELTQKSKRRLEHSITITYSEQEKHTMVTVYKNNKGRHEINTDIQSTQLEQPLKIEASAYLEHPSDFNIKAALNENYKELYSIHALSKLDEEKSGKWNLELAHPERKVKLQAKFDKVNNKINTDALVNWNVRSQEKPEPQIRVNGQFTHESESDRLSVKGNVRIHTPFENYEKLNSNVQFEKSESEIKSGGRVSWDGNGNHIISELSAKLPISVEDAQVSFKAKTPFENYRKVELELDHKMDSEIKTTLNGKLGRDHSELVIKGRRDFNDYSKSIKADVMLKTPYQYARKIVMNIDHSQDEKEIKSILRINKDGEKYNVDFSKSYNSHRSTTERSSHLIISGPDRSTQTSFTHKSHNGRHQITASIDSAQNNKKQRYNIDIKGKYNDLKHMHLNVDVKSPLKSFKKIGLEICNDVEKQQLKNKVIIQLNRIRTGYDIKLKNEQQEKTVDVLLLLRPAFVNDVYLKSNVQYDKYPVTMSSKISWAPSSVIDLTGSYKAQSQDDLELNLKLTTPFEDLKNVDLVASHILKNSVRVSHLNLDYDVRKMVDVEVRSQNDDQRKLLRLKVKVPSSHFQSLDTGVSIDTKRGLFSKADLELQLNQDEKYEGTMSLKVSGVDNIRGKIEIKTPIDEIRHIESSFVKDGRKDDKRSSLQLTNNNEKLIDIKAETEKRRNHVNMKVYTQGKLLSSILQTVDELCIFPMMHKDEDGNIIQQLITEVTVEQQEQDQTVQVDTSVIGDYGRITNKHTLRVRKAGEQINNMDIDISFNCNDRRSMKGKLTLKLVDDIKIQAVLKDFFGNKHGFEISHSRDSDRTETKGTLHLNEIRKLESSFELFISSIQRIEFTSTTKSNVKGYELTKVKYTHEGQDNRLSCSLSVEDVEGIKASIDLVGQTSPIHLFSLIVKTPIAEYKKMAISGDYDETKVKVMLMLNEDKEISLSGSHNNFKNPKFTLKTPLRQLQLLSVNVDGQLSHGSSSFTLQFNDNDQIKGKVQVHYDNPSQVKLEGELESRIDESEHNVKVEVETKNEPRKTHIRLAVDQVNQIKYDSHSEQQHRSSENNQGRMDIEIKYPSLGLQTQGLIISLEGDVQKSNGKIQLLGKHGKLVDADIDIDLKNDKKASLIVREPKYMEYRFTQENFPESNDNKIYFNWDKSNPDSNLVIRCVMKDESSSHKMDKSVSLRISCPRRSISLEHSIVATKTKVQSSGKIYWSDDKESQLSYQLNLKDESNRRQTSYDGELKVKVPTRTISIVGLAKDQSDKHHVESTLSWDLDNDASKKIGVSYKQFKESHTKTHVSLILPKDAHIDSEIVMNKGNTILEGQTQIFYSDNSKKTLTIFSKLENNPGQSSFFYSSNDKQNYSLQFGVSHPESNIDVKMVSHLGMDSDRLTTSVGLDYLTSRKQMKNMDLFVEINKLKKEISLQANTPYKNVGLSGSIVSQNPLELKAASTVDNQEHMSAHLLVHPSQKKINIDFTNENKELHYSAHFPNKTALLLKRERRENGQVERDIKVLVQLTSPRVLQTDLQWRPGMLKDTRDSIFDFLKKKSANLKELSEEISRDVREEVQQKYRDIASIFDDAQEIARSMEQEIASFEKDLEQIQQNARKDFEFCRLRIGELDLEEEISRLQQEVQRTVEKVHDMVKPHTQRYRDNLRSVADKLELLKNIPADVVYQKVIEEIGKMENHIFKTFFWDLLRLIHDMTPQEFEDIWKIIDHLIEKGLNPQPMIEDLNESMHKVMNTKISSQLTQMISQNKKVISQLKIVLKKLKQVVSDHPVTQQISDIVEEHANELYQLARWTINYWEIDNTLPEQLDKLVDFLNQLMQEELKAKMGPMYRFIRNPITQFDPEQGILQAQFPLVISMDRLDQAPSIMQISEKVADYMEEKYGSNSSKPVTDLPDVMDDFDTYLGRRDVTKRPDEYGVVSYW